MDYYDILNVSNDATLKEINKKLKTLSLKYHPDLNPDDRYSEEKMKIITEAYSVLSNYEKRVEYDMKLENNSITPFSFKEGQLELLNSMDELSLINKMKSGSVIEDNIQKTKKAVKEDSKTKSNKFTFF